MYMKAAKRRGEGDIHRRVSTSGPSEMEEKEVSGDKSILMLTLALVLVPGGRTCMGGMGWGWT